MDTSDVFSFSDRLLAERLQFDKEIGFGNWGSVWLCRPKSSSGKVKDMEVAVKLVHRSKTSTTSARVRSLWNEMKIVRSFKNDPHPSIVPFHSFIITPSYALITMAYLPTLIPVEVSETRAKEWFKSLLSGVHFLHSRGVVHNDIKPANILLSRANIPVLVDFGFAEKYDLSSPKAFHSNLTYGTPEYLSPERSRGLPHDTRRSDIWSLGITFFEILIGRTPFEYEEGEVFEKKEDLEKYWHRTMRGKWVGKYSMSQAAERFLKRMIVPNADLRCTAAEIMSDAYWDGTPATPVHAHRKVASAAVLSSSHARTSSVFDSFKLAFKEKDKDKEQSQPRLLDISLPWSASRSTPKSSASRPMLGLETASRSASRMAAGSRPASRTEFNSKPVPGTLSDSHSQMPRAPLESSAPTNPPPVASSVSPVVRTRTNSRSKSQPRLRTPPDISNATRTRKLSTVQASPIVKSLREMNADSDSEWENDLVRKGRANAGASRRERIISLNSASSSSLKRPLGPRQPSPRIVSVSKEPPVLLGRVGTTTEKHALSHLPHPHTPVNRTRAPHRLPTPRNTPQPSLPSSNQTPSHVTQASRQILASKQLSGRPPRTRGRVGALADLTSFARNVDLSAHGVERPTRSVAEKRDRGKENTKSHTTVHKQHRENDSSSSLVHVHTPSGDAHASMRLPAAAPFILKTPTKEEGAATLSGATRVARGSVRDRMMDWERERERLREMDRLSEANADGDRGSTILTGTTTTSESSDDDDSEVEAEVAAELASVQAKTKVPGEAEAQKDENPDVERERPATTPTLTSVSSSSDLERSRIEVAKIGVRASAQMLSSRNGSVSALGLNQSVVKRRASEDGNVKNTSVTDIGLPVEVQRNGESGFTSLKHSVKASIDKGVRLYKSSLGQLTSRPTPAWCSSPEPIDFEQRRSGEEGRFSWENIRPEREVAVDRMNMWIQSVEKVVEETRQNFASTSVTPPAALPLVPASRSSSQHPSTANTLTPAIQNISNNDNVVNVCRLSRPPRRLLAANEIFAGSTDPNALPLSPSPPAEGTNHATSGNPAPESLVPAITPTSALTQTPRRRRATISTRTPMQERNGSTTSGVFEGSPSRHKEKSKSQSNLDRHIQDIAKLELELNRAPVSSPKPRLSTVLDRSLFVAPPVSPRFTEDSETTVGTARGRSFQFDDINSSSYNVEPYPAHKSGEKFTFVSPDKRHLEGVYDRFLMATSGVKRVGKGYQSDNLKLVDNTMSTPEPVRAVQGRGFAVFGTSKRTMPAPVPSEDPRRRAASIDELGFITAGQHTNTRSSRMCKDESKRTFVRRAIRAMVPGRTASRRLSRTIVA